MVVSYTVITAPCDGYVGRKDIHVGLLVQPGQLMVKIVDDANVWIIADYRETQMQHIAVGSEVKISADALPDAEFTGHVEPVRRTLKKMPSWKSVGMTLKRSLGIAYDLLATCDKVAECLTLKKSICKKGEEMSQTGTLDNAWILIDGERISSFGTMDGCPKDEADEVIDAERGMVLPTFCDSHTHIVFACTREAIERSL